MSSVKAECTQWCWNSLGMARKLFGHQRVRQTLTLYSSEIGLMVLTLGTGILNSRFLGATQYGQYTFVITMVEVVTLFGGFGVSHSGARLLALSDSGCAKPSLTGALVFVGAGLGVVCAALLALAAPLIELVFNTEGRSALYLGAILCVTAPVSLILGQACRGTNKIGLLAALTIFPKLLYLVGASVVIMLDELSILTSLSLYLGGTLGAICLAIAKLRIRFNNFRANLAKLWAQLRSYGFNVYLGGLADNSTYKVTILLIAAFVDTTWIGFYYIAATIVGPMARFSTSLASSFYRGFAKDARIPPKVFLINSAFLVAAALGIVIVVRPFITIVLTPEYLPATMLVYILLFTAFFKGSYTPINFFLAAHGKGRESRTISFVVSGVNICCAILFVPWLGAVGAALSSAIAKLTELSGNVYFYRRTLQESLKK